MNRKIKIIVFAAALAVIVTVVCAVPVLSYMFKQRNIVNKLDPAIVTCRVEETFDKTNGIKSSIKVENTGNIEAYIRVRLISSWVTKDDDVLGMASKKPEIKYDTTNWIYDAANDTYYCKTPIAPKGLTPELLTEPYKLFESSYDVETQPIHVYQRLDVIAEAVQSIPDTAVKNMWPFVEVYSGNLITAPPPTP